MARVIYTGPADIRLLGSKDLQKAGVEGFKATRFQKNIPQEVDDVVAEALINDEQGLFAGSFKEAPEMKKVGEAAEAEKAEKATDKNQAEGESSSTPDAGTSDTDAGGTTNGASTRGSTSRNR